MRNVSQCSFFFEFVRSNGRLESGSVSNPYNSGNKGDYDSDVSWGKRDTHKHKCKLITNHKIKVI